MHALVISIGDEHLTVSYGRCRIVQEKDQVVGMRVAWLCALQISLLVISNNVHMSLV